MGVPGCAKGVNAEDGDSGGSVAPVGAVGLGQSPPPVSQQHLQMQPAPGQSRPVTINLLTAQGQGWLVPGGERATGWGGTPGGGSQSPQLPCSLLVCVQAGWWQGCG